MVGNISVVVLVTVMVVLRPLTVEVNVGMAKVRHEHALLTADSANFLRHDGRLGLSWPSSLLIRCPTISAAVVVEVVT